MKTKSQEWREFADTVADHITGYCIPQYGDYPDTEIEEWTISDIKAFLRQYVNRIGTTVRGPKQAKSDALKIAHYGCFLLNKLEEVDDDI